MPRLAPLNDTIRFKQTMVDVYYPINWGQCNLIRKRGIQVVEGGGGLVIISSLKKFKKNFEIFFFWSIQ